MIRDANPQDKACETKYADAQTFEFRAGDGSANIHHLLAGLAVAVRHGFEMNDALELANKLYVDVNIFADEHKKIQEKLPQLPASCWESADCLLEDRAIYEKDGVFSPVVIEGISRVLKAYDDKDLSERLYGKQEEIKKLVEQYLYC